MEDSRKSNIRSEKDEIILFERIRQSIARAQREMLERKAKMDEPVIITNGKGMPLKVSAMEALRKFNSKFKKYY